MQCPSSPKSSFDNLFLQRRQKAFMVPNPMEIIVYLSFAVIALLAMYAQLLTIFAIYDGLFEGPILGRKYYASGSFHIPSLLQVP